MFQKYFSQIKKFTSEKSFIIALVGVIGLAISVNMVELACSAGLPLVFTELLAINNVNTEGIYKLLKDGATMVTKGEDVLNALSWQIEKVEKNDTKLNLNETEQIIFDIIGVEPKGFDEIQSETEMPTNDLLMCLTGMELRGLIEQVEGDRYKRG